jgi:predicted transcriptional regulator
MPRSELIKVRVEPDLKARLENAAKGERRSTSDLVRVLAEAWLTEHGY